MLKKIPIRFLFIGVLFGMLFPTVALIADSFWVDPASEEVISIAQRVQDNPIHLIIMTAPFILGGTFYFIGFYLEKQRKLNRKLLVANRSMHEANELLDTFNYHVSHDLKTVLNNQLVLARMVKKYGEKRDWEKVNEIIDKQVAISEDGLDTVANFLRMSREGYLGETEKSEFVFEDEIKSILEKNNLVDHLRVSFNKKEFRTVFMQKAVFRSIFLNLITNSIKYCEPGIKPKVDFDLVRTTDGKRITYTDNGIGIDLKKNGHKLFQPFERIESKIDGTGVGLYIVQKLVQAYSGTINVESELGKGTQFQINFPD